MNDIIRPCAECQRDTRPPTAKIADHEGTIVRRGVLCDTCWRASSSLLTPTQRRALDYHLAGLASFLRRRNERAEAMLRRAYYEERIAS